MSFAVKFLGCKVSQADAMLARRRLLETGHVEAGDGAADVVVINTCCITREAEAKSRQAARRALAGGASRVIVTGCAANLGAGQFAAIGDGVTALRGVAEEVAEDLARRFGPACIDGRQTNEVGSPANGHGAARTRAFVKIQDGCDYRCAYCIIPTVRGAARSRPAAAVLEEVLRCAELGQPEAVLTGISVGGYRDRETGWNLARLMREVAQIDGVARVRLSSVEVTHLTDALIGAVASEEKICPHLHVPLQSGDDGVLAAVNRHYDVATYLRTLERARNAVPGLNVTTDVIVGFPTEDERAFANTLQVVERAGITKVHTFPFSERPGTAAERLGDPVPPQEKKRRSRELRGLSEALGLRHRLAKIGERATVLIDKRAPDRASGYTDDYTRVHLSPESGATGALVQVMLAELRADGIWGAPSL